MNTCLIKVFGGLWSTLIVCALWILGPKLFVTIGIVPWVNSIFHTNFGSEGGCTICSWNEEASYEWTPYEIRIFLIVTELIIELIHNKSWRINERKNLL